MLLNRTHLLLLKELTVFWNLILVLQIFLIALLSVGGAACRLDLILLLQHHQLLLLLEQGLELLLIELVEELFAQDRHLNQVLGLVSSCRRHRLIV